MENSITTNQKNVATLIHLSTFSKYIIPLGNFIIPLLLWMAQKKESIFIDNHGRRALNFQISMLLYTVAILMFSIPFIIWQALQIAENNNGYYDFGHHFDHISNLGDVSALLVIIFAFVILLVGQFLFEIIMIISAAVSASKGMPYKYPLTINFIQPLSVDVSATPSA